MMAEDQPHIPPVPNSGRLARFYVENKVLLDRLIMLVLAAVLSYLGYDKLQVIEDKTDTAAIKAETAANKAVDSAEVGLKTLIITAEDAGRPQIAAEARGQLEATTAPTAGKWGNYP